jgi:predicted TIM-barrel fold metal-dependent hydrolase
MGRHMMDRTETRSLRQLVNELARVEEGIRRTRGMMGAIEAEHDEGLRALIARRDELVRLVGVRRASSHGTKRRLAV